jgi:SAM-dependent methyltransferase
MPIGSYTHRLTRSPIKRVLNLAFGMSDLHSHLRLRPMLDYVEGLSTLRTSGRTQALELGCGGGINLFELAQRFPSLHGLGYDLNRSAITSAREVAARLFPERLIFHEADACRQDLGSKVDIVLLIDFLEHVPDPKGLMRRVSGCVRVGGQVLISVPTTRYPQVFGREFHKAVGHLVDGYDLTTLNALVPKDLTLAHHRYSTGVLASALCALFYRVLRRLPDSVPVKLLRLCTVPAARVDFFNGPNHSCSLFAAYKKV